MYDPAIFLKVRGCRVRGGDKYQTGAAVGAGPERGRGGNGAYCDGPGGGGRQRGRGAET